MANSKPRTLTTKHLCIAAAAPLSDAAELWRTPQEITRRSDGAALGQAVPGGAPENGIFALQLSLPDASPAIAAEALTALLGLYFEQNDVFWARLETEPPQPELADALTGAGFGVTPQPDGRLLAEKAKSAWLAIGMCLGVGMGMSLGTAFGAGQGSGLSFGMCIGIAVGMAIGVTVDERDAKRRDALRQAAGLPPAPPRVQRRQHR